VIFVYYTPSALASPDLHRIVLGAAWGTWHGAPGRGSCALHDSQALLAEVLGLDVCTAVVYREEEVLYSLMPCLLNTAMFRGTSFS